MSASPRTIPASRMTVEDRRAHLLQVGRQVFSDRSYDAVSTDDVARAAGISKGLLYHYFQGKRGFYVATIQDVAERFLDATRLDRPDAEGDPLQAALDGFLDFAEAHPALFRALVRGGIGSDAEVDAVVAGVRDRTAARLAARLELDADDPAVDLALHAWIGAAEAAALRWLEPGAACDRAQVRATLQGALLALVGAR